MSHDDGLREGRIEAVSYPYEDREHETIGACNLCGGERFVEVARRDRYGFRAPLQVCVRCGLGFLSPRLTASEYAEFYASVYRRLVSAYHGREINPQTVQAEQRLYGEELVAFLLTSLPRAPATVLDVGGSTGVVASAVRDQFGCGATVVDPSPAELAHAAEAGMETICGFAEHLDLADRTFDLVLLCQTIDHLLDIGAALRSIRRWVAPAGRVFVDVLDVEFMLRRAGSIERAAKIDHPYYLTRETALAYFLLAGFEPAAERMSADGHLGFLLAPAAAIAPDWIRLSCQADELLAEIWRLRAVG